MAQQGQADVDADQPASEFKLEQARRRGSIVRSNELVFAVALASGVACVYGFGERMLDALMTMGWQALPLIRHEHINRAVALAIGGELLYSAALSVGPVIFVLWVSTLAMGVAQARGVLTTKPLHPDFSRLNPATGLKRMLSARSLYELGRTLLKIAVLSGVCVMWGERHLSQLLRLMSMPPAAMSRSGIALLGSALVHLLIVVTLFALLHWSMNRWEFMRRMRMSRREIKDEHKEREGDPRIRARLRELRQQWLKRARQLSNVRSADVLLTNPTHYAIALEYRSGEMPSPMITAKGAGELARRMKAEARRRGVPIIENPPLARELFRQRESEMFVTEAHFEQVARALRWAYAARAKVEAARTAA